MSGPVRGPGTGSDDGRTSRDPGPSVRPSVPAFAGHDTAGSGRPGRAPGRGPSSISFDDETPFARPFSPGRSMDGLDGAGTLDDASSSSSPLDEGPYVVGPHGLEAAEGGSDEVDLTGLRTRRGGSGDRVTRGMPPTRPPSRAASSDDIGDALDLPPVAAAAEAFDEFEQDELPPEMTEVDGRELLSGEASALIDDGPAFPLLVVEHGRDRGRDFVLQEGETTIGRGIDNEVILSDVSVSRRHVRIDREGSALTLHDLGSGNGTSVNGHRVRSVLLEDGDRIELGESVLVVRVPGAPLAAVDPAPIVPGPESMTDETQQPAALRSVHQVLGTSAETPWSLPAGGDRSEVQPGWPDASERTGSVVLDRRVLVAAAFGVALLAALLGGLVMGVVLWPDETTVVSELQSPAAPRPAVGTSVPPGVGSAPSRDAVPVGSLPPLPAPGPVVGAGAVGDRVPSAGAGAAGRPVAPGPRSRRSAPSPSQARGPRGGRTSSRFGRPSAGLEAVLGPYRAANFSAAAGAARAAGETALSGQIDAFAVQYRSASSAARGSSQRLAALERAVALDGQIVSGGAFGERLRPELLAAYLDAAQASIEPRAQEACHRVQQALRIDGSAPRAVSLARQCEQRARELLDQAQAAESGDPVRARSMYQSVLPMVSSQSATYARARARVDALARRRVVDEDE